jgi:phosphoribosyl 1,2-cyclic phosphodiesterase
MQIKFRGVRGSIPTPVRENLGYGGNTSCVEVLSRRGGVDERLIIDLGSGARALGLDLLKQTPSGDLSLNVLMTHFHWDHIQGLPFFAPLYSPSTEAIFYASLAEKEIRSALAGQMASPHYPVSFESMAAQKQFVRVSGEAFDVNPFRIQPFPLNHPQGATGYRIELDGQVYVHASDLEHGDARLDRVLRDHCQNADVLVMDAQYTPAEYEWKRGWGHGTWMEAAQVARDCKVDRLILFHHDPIHDDRFLDGMANEARRVFENTDAAKEDTEWELGSSG